MKFRKLYWVTEQLDASGHSHVAGVYTSIWDLIHRGLRWEEAIAAQDGFRLSLVQLDATKPPLGTWQSPEFAGIAEDLQEYVRSAEFNAPDVEDLAKALREFATVRS